MFRQRAPIFVLALASVMLLGQGCSFSRIEGSVETEKFQGSPAYSEPATQEEYAKADLIGRWQSADDRRETIEFSQSEKMNFYDDVLVASGSYRLDGDQLTVNDQFMSEPLVYTVVSLTDQELTLRYQPRGNTLRYRRLEDGSAN